jgi:acyl-CoA synthetase (AMP-forming)/AMP-acid ligase II
VCAIGGDIQLAKPNSCGSPFPIVEFIVVDTETMAVLLPGATGELLVNLIHIQL